MYKNISGGECFVQEVGLPLCLHSGSVRLSPRREHIIFLYVTYYSSVSSGERE
jgi:hypothetical protein